MKTSLTLVLLLAVGLTQAPAEVHKRLRSDGSVEYYNAPKQRAKKSSGVPVNFSSPYDFLIEALAKNEGVDPFLVKCIIKVESNFNPRALSVAGAKGLMQLMDEVSNQYKVTDPYDPWENLQAGIKHFKVLLVYFKNDIPLALAAYHAGLSRVRKNMAIPPITATIKYVKRIMGYYDKNAAVEIKVRRLYKRIEKDTIVIYN